MYAMVVFGFGELIGCFFIGWIVDQYGSKFAAVIDVLIIVL
jgi:MFS family permease